MAKKILLADDSITIQKVVELTFSDGDYEVIATNNGAKAIQKLSEIRPDIILSDIIMPEKNGYEVCEFVKSHPEYRDIPVILLTGTFEPFDPDRAEKAGCDAVVTKPFESQSLVHKVEELIQQSQSSSSASFDAGPEEAAPLDEPEPEIPLDETASTPQPWGSAGFDRMEPPPPPPAETTPFDEPPPPPPPAEMSSPFDDSSARLRALFGSESAPPAEGEFATHDDDIFGATEAAPPAPEMPFEPPPEEPVAEAPFEEPGPVPYSGETRAFPRMSFDELQQLASAPMDEPPADTPDPFATSEELPPAPPEFAAEPPSFPHLTLDESPQFTPPPPPDDSAAAQPAVEPEPPPAPDYAGETRAFPAFSLDDLSAMEPPTTAPPTIEQPPLGDFAGVVHPPEEMPVEPLEPPSLEPTSFEPPAEASRDALHEGAFEPPPPPAEEAPVAYSAFEDQRIEEPLPGPEASEQPLFDEADAPAAFDEEVAEEPPLDAATSEPSPLPVEETPAWDQAAEEPAGEAWSPSAFSAPEPPPAEEPRFAAPAEAPLDEPPPAVASDEDAWSPAAPPAIQPPAVPSVGRIEPLSMPSQGDSGFNDEQVERIARRVVELISEKLIRDIAWEVIPDLAETIVKERIRELENEA